MQSGTEASVERLFADLSGPQREAVAHTDGPLLILAGPGSGKTRVITRRAAHLACTVTEPYHILAITFTNKAAKGMRQRIEPLALGEGMTVCTFHALCAKLLRWHHERTGVPRNFTIFDRDDRRKLIKTAIERCNLSTDNLSPASVDQDIGRAKNAMLTAAQFASRNLDWRERMIARIYECYENLLTEMGGLDFDDLLMRMAIALSRDGALRAELENRYRFVLIDEYQDTNAAQYQIARLLTQEHQNLCATGDPDQSIYGWRGADIGNILSFERDYAKAKVVRLEQNYRSTKRILAAADALIAGNVMRKEKGLWTENDEGPVVRVLECEDGVEEAEAIASDIAQRIGKGVNPGDIAVFYRINSMSRVIEDAVRHRAIAYQIARGVEFYNRKEIKDVLAYLRVLVNSSDEVALVRIINPPPRGIGATTIERLKEQAEAKSCRIFDVLMDDALSSLGRSGQKVREFGQLLRQLAPVLDLPPGKALETVISHSGLRALYRESHEIDDAPSANLDELISAASEFQLDQPEATVVDWLEHAALISDVDAVRGEGGAVTLMTLHAAKGLEFAHVYMIGLEEGLLPFRRADDGPSDNGADDEEERRLCFVGMTRTKKSLTMSRARYRMLRGVTQRTTRSRFLDELPEAGVEWPEPENPTKRASVAVPAANGHPPEDLAELTIGTLVRHPQQGLGQILSIHRGGRRTHVDVQFENGSQRSWVVEFAELQRVDFDEVG